MLLPPLSFSLLFLLCLFGIQRYIDLRKQPRFLATTITLATFLPLSIIILLPIDYISSNFQPTAFAIPPKWVLVIWKSNYWTTFVLTWAILPMLKEYLASGQWTRSARFRDALRHNIKFQLTVLGAGACGAAYLMLETGLSPKSLKLMIIALSHIYSLIFALWAMGHGLVQLPKMAWIRGNTVGYLNHLYSQVPSLSDALEDTRVSFKEDATKVWGIDVNTLDIHERDCVLGMVNRIGDHVSDHLIEHMTEHVTDAPASLTALSKSFHKHLRLLTAHEAEFNALFLRIIQLEDVLAARGSELVYRIPPSTLLPGRFHHVWYQHVRPITCRIISLLLFASSFVVLESEFFHSTRISIVNQLIWAPYKAALPRIFLTAAVFSYMLWASIHALTSLRVFAEYRLVPRESDAVSACFYATHVARITIPLSYNFVTLFIARDCTFEAWFGQSVHLTGLFNLLNNWLPRLVLIPMALSTFDVYDKLKKRLGLQFDDSWFFDEDVPHHERADLVIVEAKRIVNREFSKRQRAQGLRPFNLAESEQS